jgi:hypothetical protein
MSYRIAQDFEYAGNDYWRWSAWIDAEATELDEVEAVVWILHPTFKQSRVRVTERSSQFKLTTAGWGTFLLRAELALKGGDKRLLKHNLRLDYPTLSAEAASTDTPAARAARPLTVFLSYSGQDALAASKLRNTLTQAGIDVLDQTQIPAADSLTDAVKRLIARADGVLAFVGDDEVSPWVRDELGTAVSGGKPAFALLGPSASNVGIPTDVNTLRVDADPSDVTFPQVAELVRSWSSED